MCKGGVFGVLRNSKILNHKGSDLLMGAVGRCLSAFSALLFISLFPLSTIAVGRFAKRVEKGDDMELLYYYTGGCTGGNKTRPK